MNVKSSLQSLHRGCRLHPSHICSDSVDGSIDCWVNDILIKSNYSIYFSDKWYLQVFDTAVFAETLEKIKKV